MTRAARPRALCDTTAGALGLLQDSGGGIGQHLTPQDNIRGVRILSKVVANAADTRDEYHGAGQVIAEHHGIMASGAWHVHPGAGGMALCGGGNLPLQRGIHHSWPDRHTVWRDRNFDGPLTVGSSGEVMPRLLQLLQAFRLWVAILQDHFCFAGDNAGRPWMQGDAANGPDGFWPSDGLKGGPQLRGEIDQGHPSIFA